MSLLFNPPPKPRPLSIQFSATQRHRPLLPFFTTFVSNSCDNPETSSLNGRKSIKTKTHFLKPFINPGQKPNRLPELPRKDHGNGNVNFLALVADKQMLYLCGFGYWLQGFRCFPWLALNFHMVQGLNLDPSTLQLVQFSSTLPMVAKPLYGVLSDAIYFGDAHRLPYISFGAFVQLLSWVTLALVPVRGTFSTQMACILLSNFGASMTEIASDALVAESSKRNKMGELQSYAFMALAAGGILGNLSGGLFLQQTQPKIMFFIFSILLSLQLAICLATKETSLCLSQTTGPNLVRKSIMENLSKQYSGLIAAISEESISRPLTWAVASIAIVPILSGTTFCYQTQCLKLNPSIIGMSKVLGQLLVLGATVFYSKYLKNVPMRKLICGIQITYAFSILSDWFLVKQLNTKVGISNEAYVLCLSALAEGAAQFKFLPFSVLFANLSPPGSEGSLVAFLASAFCLASIIGGLLGFGLASVLGISSEDYSNLPVGIILQFLAALLPLVWISQIPMLQNFGKGKKISKRRRMLPLRSGYEGRTVKLQYRGKGG